MVNGKCWRSMLFGFGKRSNSTLRESEHQRSPESSEKQGTNSIEAVLSLPVTLARYFRSDPSLESFGTQLPTTPTKNPIEDCIKAVYPTVISPELFKQAEEARASTGFGRRNPNGNKLNNLFEKRTHCAIAVAFSASGMAGTNRRLSVEISQGPRPRHTKHELRRKHASQENVRV